MPTPAKTRPWSIQCILDWLSIREKQGHEFPKSLLDFITELDHSALLRRLIEGKNPLPTPPPLSFGYPWYELIDNGEAEAFDVWASDEKMSQSIGYPALIINQHPWHIAEKRSEEEYIVTHEAAPSIWRASVVSIGTSPTGLARKNWKVTRVDTTPP